MIEQYAKRDVKVIVLGNTAATILSHFAKSIPRKNITSLSKYNMNICTAYVRTFLQSRAMASLNSMILCDYYTFRSQHKWVVA